MATTIRVAAAGDIHAGSDQHDRIREAFEQIAESADLVLLAGDLTQHGQVDEAEVVADACRGVEIPVVAVLGNHDWQSDRPDDLRRALGEAGVVTLERSHSVELGYLTLATLYSLTLPLKRSVTLIDAVVLVSIFIA